MPSRRESDRPAARRVRVVHPHAWLWEPLAADPTFVLRAMFGAKAVYLGGRMVLCFCAGEEPWRGVLVCTDRDRHPALVAAFPALAPHPILPKWLYLPEAAGSFETDATRLVALARARDPRIGIEPGSRNPSRRPAPRRSKRARRPDSQP